MHALGQQYQQVMQQNALLQQQQCVGPKNESQVQRENVYMKEQYGLMQQKMKKKQMEVDDITIEKDMLMVEISRLRAHEMAIEMNNMDQ